MEKPTESPPDARRSGLIPFADTESGMLAGLWYVPVAGFEWRPDLRPLSEYGEILERDAKPSDPGPWLVARGRELRRYPPMRRRGLLEALDRVAAVQTPDAVLSFAHRYGPLGVGNTLVPARRINGTWVAGSGTLTSGESLGEWRSALLEWRDLRLLGQAVAITGQPDSWGSTMVVQAKADLKGRISWSLDGGCSYHSRTEVDGAWREWHERIHHPSDPDSGSVARHLSGKNTFEAARYYLHRQVNAQLRGTINAAVLPYLGGAIRFFPDSLKAAAYLRFAQELAGQLGVQRECEYCHMPFEPTRRDHRFCGKNCQEASAYHRRLSGVPRSG